MYILFRKLRSLKTKGGIKQEALGGLLKNKSRREMDVQAYYKARGKLMFILRQEYQCEWAPLSYVCNKIGMSNYQQIIKYEKSANHTEKRLEWTVDSVRALTKDERRALVPRQPTETGEDVGMHHMSDEKQIWREGDTVENAWKRLDKSVAESAKEATRFMTEFGSVEAQEEAEQAEAETYAAWAQKKQAIDERVPTATGSRPTIEGKSCILTPASSSRMKRKPRYEVEVSESDGEIEIELPNDGAESDSDECVIVEETLAMEPLAPLKRKRTQK
jgi:hypothetical protein